MNVKLYKLWVCLIICLLNTQAKAQDVLEYSVISKSDIPDTLLNYSNTNFTAYDMYLYLELKQRDNFTKLFPFLIDSTLVAYKGKSLKEKYTYHELRDGFRTKPVIEEFYDSVTKTIYKYNIAPEFIYHAKSVIIDLPNSLGFELYSDKTIYINFKDVRKYVGDEEIALLNFLKAKGLLQVTDSSITKFAKKEIHQLAKKLYDIGVSGKATMFWNYYDTNTYTKETIKDRISPEWFKTDTNKNTGEIVRKKIVSEFSTDSLKYIRLYSYWEEPQQFGYSTSIKFIAPTTMIWLGGLELPISPAFLLKLKDVLPYFTKEELEFYSYCFIFNLSNRMTNPNIQQRNWYSREYPPEGYVIE